MGEKSGQARWHRVSGLVKHQTAEQTYHPYKSDRCKHGASPVLAPSGRGQKTRRAKPRLSSLTTRRSAWVSSNEESRTEPEPSEP